MAENKTSDTPLTPPPWLRKGAVTGTAVWRATWKTGDGKHGGVLTLKGASSEELARNHFGRVLRTMTNKALKSGASDPGLELVTVEAAGVSNALPGAFRPRGARPVNLNQFAKPAPESAQ